MFGDPGVIFQDFLGEEIGSYTRIISGCWDIFLDLQMSHFCREVKLYKHFCDTYPIALLEAWGFVASQLAS